MTLIFVNRFKREVFFCDNKFIMEAADLFKTIDNFEM